MRLFAGAKRRLPPQLTFHDDYHGKVVRRVLAKLALDAPYSRLRAPEQGLRFARDWLAANVGSRRPVVITLRQYDFQELRNSNIAAWAEFADSLDPAVYCPVIVPETMAAFKAPDPLLAKFPHFTEASIDVGMRMAIYELAYLDMFVSNGPVCLCTFSNACRSIFFKLLLPNEYASSADHIQSLGFTIGTTPDLGGSKFVKWVWEDDTFPVLRREFDAMVKRIEADAAATGAAAS
jgi:hypothetical protein